ncbi:MAG: HAMP domain-containing protein [Chloroflexi bacterium]|nr:HAMP domain-containing protein [Chloroflexota bacterium]
MGLQRKLTIYGAVGLVALTAFLAYLALSTINQVNTLIYEERVDRAEEIAQDISMAFDHIREEAGKSVFTTGQGLTAAQALPGALGSLQSHLRQHLATIHSFAPPIFVGISDAQGRVLWAEPYWADRIDATVPDAAEFAGIYQSRSLLNQGDSGISLVLPVSDGQQREGYLIVEIVPLAGSFDTFLQSRSHRFQLQVIMSDSGAIISSSVPLGQEEISPDWAVVRPMATAGRAGLIEHGAEGDYQPHMAVYAPVPDVPLGIVLEDVAGKALALPGALSRRLLVLIGLAVTLLAASAWLVSRGLVRPIEHLAQSAQRIAEGDLETPIPSLTHDEIGNLASNLEMMRQRLKASLDDIKGWNARLEQQVRERTRQVGKLYGEVAHREEQCHLLLDRIITAQEDERRRLARELHDETGQFLTGLVLALKGLEERVASEPQMVREQLQSIRNLTTKATEDVRRLIWDLRPSLLDDMGLVDAIGWYLENHLKPKGVKCHLATGGFSRRLPPAVESSLFRLCQEAVNNIAKHAQASQAWIDLQIRGEMVAGSISDDGGGFDPARLASGANTGLLGMQERVNLLGGKLEIKSSPGKGTTIQFRVPLKEGQHG